MSAALIQQALMMGYTAKQILAFISHQMPNLANGIKSAAQAGYPEEMVLRFLANQIPSKDAKAAQKQYSHQQKYLRDIGIKTKEERAEDRNEILRNAAQLGLAGVSGYRLATSLGMLAGQAMPQPGPTPGPTVGPTVGPTPTPPAPPAAPQPPPAGGTPPTGGAPPTPPSPQVTQQLAPPAGQGTPQTPGPMTPPQPNPKSIELIKKMGFANIVRTLSPTEDPQTIANVIKQHFIKPGQTKWLQTQTQEPLEKIVEDYIALQPKVSEAVPEPVAEKILPQAKEAIAPEPEKKAAMLPSGEVGTLTDVKQGIATVEVDGKPHHIRQNEVSELPITERELADIFNELKAKIEEETGEEISRMAGFVGYDAEHNELAFRGHTGDLYIFDEIDPEDVKFLTDASVMRKTSGENYIGPWTKGTETVIGAKMHQLFMKYKNRAEEQSKPTSAELSELGIPIETPKAKAHKAKFEAIYDPWAIAHKAAAAKKAAAKKAEKEKEKAAKKEEKEREKAAKKRKKQSS